MRLCHRDFRPAPSPSSFATCASRLARLSPAGEAARGYRADSVLDAGAEARSVKRLFIADNSALPNGVSGVNPTLTTQALATRTAENIFQRYFGGDPWVSETAPVSSIDPAVTAAVVERRP
jgi:choline dehydrogenase-like flavoprotein